MEAAVVKCVAVHSFLFWRFPVVKEAEQGGVKFHVSVSFKVEQKFFD